MRHIPTRLSRRLICFGVIGLSLCSLLGLPSCAVTPLADSAREPHRFGRELPTYHASPDPESPPPALSEPTGELTLRATLAAALRSSPALAVFSWEVRAREARARQAGRPPNPKVGLKVEEFGGSGDHAGFDGADTTLRLSQLFELGSKRAKRQRVATLDRDLATWDYETRRLDVLTAVAKEFVITLAAQERVALETGKAQLAEAALQTVARQVKAGAVSPVEESRARVALARSQVELSQRRREQTAAQLRLAATWGSTTITFSAVVGDLEPIVPPASVDALLSHLTRNPDLARWRVEKAQRQAALQLEQARQLPDIEVDAGVRYLNADQTAALVFEVGMPLMVFDRNHAGMQEAAARVAQANAEQREAEIRSRAALVAAHQAFSSAFEQATVLRDTILPQAQAVFEEVSLAYQRGRLRYLDIFDARRTLFELRGEYVEALANYHTAAADVGRLIAEPRETLNRTDGTD